MLAAQHDEQGAGPPGGQGSQQLPGGQCPQRPIPRDHPDALPDPGKQVGAVRWLLRSEREAG